METRKLYYEDPFQKGFATTVVSCDAVKGGYAVVLAETAFYPEGGGQPYDTGVLGEANVLEVHEKNGVITHLCDKPSRWERASPARSTGRAALTTCSSIRASTSARASSASASTATTSASTWARTSSRSTSTPTFRGMNLWRLNSSPTCTSMRITPSTSSSIAARSSTRSSTAAKSRSRATCASSPSPARTAALLRHARRAFRSGGTRQVPLRAEVPRRVRIELLSGKRAHRYLSECWAQDVRIAQALSVKPNASFAGVERVLAELSALKQRCAKLEESVFAQAAAQYEGKGDVLLFEDEMSGDSCASSATRSRTAAAAAARSLPARTARTSTPSGMSAAIFVSSRKR